MEHFIAPNGANPVDIPFLCTEEWDGGDFFGYLERKGWSFDDLMDHRTFGDRTKEGVEEFFQTWLYFGTLISVFGFVDIQVTTHDFIRETKDGQKFITTEKLPRFIQEWLSREDFSGGSGKRSYVGEIRGFLREWVDLEGKDEDDKVFLSAPNLHLLNQDKSAKQFRGNKIKDILTCVVEFVNKYCNAEGQGQAKKLGTAPDYWPISSEVSLSIMALGLALEGMVECIYGLELSKQWGSSPLLNDRLQKAGWCVRDIPFRLPQSSDIDSDYYFGSYPSPRRNLDHSDCDKLACRAKNVNVKNYVTKHVTDGCKCQHVSVSIQDLLDIIRNAHDHVPIALWKQGKLSLTKVLKSDYPPGAKTKYAAISHVWSDGLGNEKQNSLPECQLSRLQGMVDELYADEGTEVGFWMDTLCVPVDEAYIDDRNAAIRQMASIYKSAYRVLVLDSYIYSVPQSNGILDRYIRLYLSNWNRRLWTLQEGVFACNLWFRFSDKATTIEDMTDDVLDFRFQSIRHVYSSILDSLDSDFKMLYFMFFGLGLSRGISDDLEILVKTVTTRATTKRTDESICLSTLMGMDPSPLFKYKNDDPDGRMACFYTMIGKFKPQIIFNPFPRLPIKGFGWAPYSFVTQSHRLYRPRGLFIYSKVPDTTLDVEGGLRVEFPGLRLIAAAPHPLGTKISVTPRNDPQVSYEVSLRLDNNGSFPAWDPDAQYMVILEEPLDEHSVGSEAILAILDGEIKDEGIPARHICLARVEVANQEDGRDSNARLHALSKKEKPFISEAKEFESRSPIYCDVLGKSQRWRIL